MRAGIIDGRRRPLLSVAASMATAPRPRALRGSLSLGRPASRAASERVKHMTWPIGGRYGFIFPATARDSASAGQRSSANASICIIHATARRGVREQPWPHEGRWRLVAPARRLDTLFATVVATAAPPEEQKRRGLAMIGGRVLPLPCAAHRDLKAGGRTGRAPCRRRQRFPQPTWRQRSLERAPALTIPHERFRYFGHFPRAARRCSRRTRLDGDGAPLLLLLLLLRADEQRSSSLGSNPCLSPPPPSMAQPVPRAPRLGRSSESANLVRPRAPHLLPWARGRRPVVVRRRVCAFGIHLTFGF